MSENIGQGKDKLGVRRAISNNRNKARETHRKGVIIWTVFMSVFICPVID